MLHFSADRLAGLDTMILKITAIPNPDKRRRPLADASNTPACAPQMYLLPPGDVAPIPEPPSFHPLPPLPSPSPLHLPSFLDFSTHSIPDPPPRRSAVSLPASALFRVPPPAFPSRRPVARRVCEGPQWIPAFHHPNSPYVPWSPPVRRRILFPSSPSSPHSRSGAVAPEPGASPTHKSGLSTSWKFIKRSIKKGVRSVVGSRTFPWTPCTRRDMLCNDDDTSPSHPRDSLASLASSDSTTLATWLAERRTTASRLVDNSPKKMSVEEYELVGSWLDLRQSDGEWVCGVQDCDMHTAGGSPHAARGYPMLCLAMPFDSTDLLSLARRSPPWSFPAGPFSTPRRFHSLPRLPCQSFDLHSTQQANCLMSMPGEWTFN